MNDWMTVNIELGRMSKKMTVTKFDALSQYLLGGTEENKERN
jgi:hypothetical protein